MGKENNIYHGSLINGPDIYSSVRDARSIRKIGGMANRLRVGQFLGDVLIGQEYSSIYALIKRDTMSTSIKANEVASGTYNSTRFGIFTNTLIINPDYTGDGLYRIEFIQSVYDESKEVEDPELMGESRYLSTNVLSANTLDVELVFKAIEKISLIQVNPNSPLDRL